jgi:hypothetical protein
LLGDVPANENDPNPENNNLKTYTHGITNTWQATMLTGEINEGEDGSEAMKKKHRRALLAVLSVTMTKPPSNALNAKRLTTAE